MFHFIYVDLIGNHTNIPLNHHTSAGEANLERESDGQRKKKVAYLLLLSSQSQKDAFEKQRKGQGPRVT